MTAYHMHAHAHIIFTFSSVHVQHEDDYAATMYEENVVSDCKYLSSNIISNI